MNIRRFVPIALVPILALAACGDDDEDTAPATAADTAAADTTTEETDAVDTTTEETDAVDTTTEETDAADTTTEDSVVDDSTATTTAGSGTAAGSGEIVVGSADFPESELLAQIYGQALAGAGFDVSYQLGIGAREIYFGAINDAEIDLVPEYTNSLLAHALRLEDPDAQPEAADVDEQVAALGEVLPDGLEVLTPSTAEDKDVIVCTAAAAEEHDLATLTDLAGAMDQITLAAPPEFEGRSPFGLVGFTQLLDAPAPAEFVPLDVSGVSEALQAGQVDCGNLFSTMSVITTADLVALEDDVPLVPNEAVLPLVRTDVADEALVATLDGVNAALDTETLMALMVQVEVDALSPEEVAAQWLDEQG
ncbi:MAG: ABC transporter substrate-binding protein [Desertimonas sp.]